MTSIKIRRTLWRARCRSILGFLCVLSNDSVTPTWANKHKNNKSVFSRKLSRHILEKKMRTLSIFLGKILWLGIVLEKSRDNFLGVFLRNSRDKLLGPVMKKFSKGISRHIPGKFLIDLSLHSLGKFSRQLSPHSIGKSCQQKLFACAPPSHLTWAASSNMSWTVAVMISLNVSSAFSVLSWVSVVNICQRRKERARPPAQHIKNRTKQNRERREIRDGNFRDKNSETKIRDEKSQTRQNQSHRNQRPKKQTKNQRR